MLCSLSFLMFKNMKKQASNRGSALKSVVSSGPLSLSCLVRLRPQRGRLQEPDYGPLSQTVSQIGRAHV